jgi:hypothetical protein
LTEFAAAAAPDAESVFVAWGLGDFRGLISLAPPVAAGDFAGVLVALGELVALAGLPVCFAPPLSPGVALMLRVLPPVLADAGEVVSVGVADPDVPVGVADDVDGVGVVAGSGVGDGVGSGVGDGVDVDVGVRVGGKVLGGGGSGGEDDSDFVGVGVGEVEWVGDEPDWDFKSSHCWLAPVTTDATRADTAAEAPDVPG